MLEDETRPLPTLSEDQLRRIRGGADSESDDDAATASSKTRPLTGFYN